MLKPSGYGTASGHSTADRRLSPAAGRCLLGFHGRLVARSGLTAGRSDTGHSPERPHVESRRRQPSEGEARPQRNRPTQGPSGDIGIPHHGRPGSNRVHVDAVIALDMALHERIADVTDVRAFCEAHRGVKRIARLRRAIELTDPATESPMETRLRMLLVTTRLPRPRAQVSIYDHEGRFLGRPDLYYPEHKLGLE